MCRHVVGPGKLCRTVGSKELGWAGKVDCLSSNPRTTLGLRFPCTRACFCPAGALGSVIFLPVWTDVISFSIFPLDSEPPMSAGPPLQRSCPPHCLPSCSRFPPTACHCWPLQPPLTSGSGVSAQCPTVRITQGLRTPHAAGSSATDFPTASPPLTPLSPLQGLHFLVNLYHHSVHILGSLISACLCCAKLQPRLNSVLHLFHVNCLRDWRKHTSMLTGPANSRGCPESLNIYSYCIICPPYAASKTPPAS